jgi:hypothetical protein
MSVNLFPAGFSDSNDDEYHTAPSLHHEVNRLAALISKMERSSAFKLQVPDVDSVCGVAANVPVRWSDSLFDCCLWSNVGACT